MEGIQTGEGSGDGVVSTQHQSSHHRQRATGRASGGIDATTNDLQVTYPPSTAPAAITDA